MNNSGFLTFSPTMAAFFCYIFDHHKVYVQDLCKNLPKFNLKILNWVAVDSPYSYGDEVDGYEGHLLVVVLAILRENWSKLPFDIDDLCCNKLDQDQMTSSEIPTVFSVSEELTELAEEKYGKKFEDLIESEKVDIENLFSAGYDYFGSFLEEFDIT